MARVIKQGDAYSLPVGVTANGGEAVSLEDIDKVEFVVGSVKKLYPDEVEYSGELGYFLVPLTQEETFGFAENTAVALDVRVKFLSGNVIGARKMIYITVADALSEEVL